MGNPHPYHQVDFLDISIHLKTGKFTFKTFQKELNLYQYLPPSSAHPDSCLKGLIFGNLQRYHKQNSLPEDYYKIAKEFYQCLLARGYDNKTLSPIFMAVGKLIDSKKAHPHLHKKGEMTELL